MAMARSGDEVQVEHWLTLDDLPARKPGSVVVDPAYLSYLAWQGPTVDEVKPEVDSKMRFLPLVLSEYDWKLLVRHQIEGQSQQEIAEAMGISQPAVSTATMRAKKIARSLSVLYTLDPKVWDPDLRGWEDLWARAYDHKVNLRRGRGGVDAAIKTANTVVLFFYTGGGELPITSPRWDRSDVPLFDSQSSIHSLMKRVLSQGEGAFGPAWWPALRAVKASCGYPSSGGEATGPWRGPVEYRKVINQWLADQSERARTPAWAWSDQRAR